MILDRRLIGVGPHRLDERPGQAGIVPVPQRVRCQVSRGEQGGARRRLHRARHGEVEEVEHGGRDRLDRLRGLRAAGGDGRPGKEVDPVGVMHPGVTVERHAVEGLDHTLGLHVGTQREHAHRVARVAAGDHVGRLGRVRTVVQLLAAPHAREDGAAIGVTQLPQPGDDVVAHRFVLASRGDAAERIAAADVHPHRGLAGAVQGHTPRAAAGAVEEDVVVGVEAGRKPAADDLAPEAPERPAHEQPLGHEPAVHAHEPRRRGCEAVVRHEDHRGLGAGRRDQPPDRVVDRRIQRGHGGRHPRVAGRMRGRRVGPEEVLCAVGSVEDDAEEVAGPAPSEPQHRLGPQPRLRHKRVQIGAYLDALVTQTRLRTEAVLRLAGRRPCDLLGVVFYAPDRAQHLFWPYAATPHASGNPRVAAAVAALYAAVDDAVGRLVAAAGPEATVVLVSDHGFAPAPTRLVRVNRWLVAEGLLVRRPLWSLRRKIIRRWLPARFDTDDYILLDRARSRAWCVPLDGPGEAAVWVHVRGRYPLGCVAPGREYESVRDHIVAGLRELRDADGSTVFAGVWRREELYHGPYATEAPDVIARCNPGYAVSMLALRADMKAERVIEPFDSVAFNGHTGVHHPDGIYLFAGPPVAARGPQPPQPIEAIAPTVLHLLDLPVPRAMEAPPCTALLAPAYLTSHPLRYRDDPGLPGPFVEPMRPDADQAAIEDHLRALGYLA